MCCGWSPFYAEDTQQMYKNICFGKIRFPKGVICDEGKQFVKGVSGPFSYFPMSTQISLFFDSFSIGTLNIASAPNGAPLS